jgi:ComF family protein
MKRYLAQLAAGVRATVFPPVCVNCGHTVEEEVFEHLCSRCVAAVDFVEEPACVTCGHPFYGELAGERICSHCEGLMPKFNRGRTAVLCRGPVRALVHELKYHHGLHVLKDVERLFTRSSRVLEFVQGSVLIPVPLHPRKERERGYNQSKLIAEGLRRAAGETVRIEGLLRRITDTKTQTAFDRKTRRANLKNAFALAKGAAIKSDLHYILVDDVFTTGSTLNSCAGVLRRAGALNLDVVTFGHG